MSESYWIILSILNYKSLKSLNLLKIMVTQQINNHDIFNFLFIIIYFIIYFYIRRSEILNSSLYLLKLTVWGFFSLFFFLQNFSPFCLFSILFPNLLIFYFLNFPFFTPLELFPSLPLSSLLFSFIFTSSIFVLSLMFYTLLF